METFETLKPEIVKRAKQEGACEPEFKRVIKSTNSKELCQVIKDNFNWAYKHKIIDCELIKKFEDIFSEQDIYQNQSISTGYLLCDSASVEAYDSAIVKAYDSAIVKAYDSASVKAYDSANVEAYNSASVEAYDSANVEANNSANVEAYNSANVEAYNSASVIAYDFASVKAYGFAYINCINTIEIKISENAIYRLHDEIYYSNPNMKFNLVKNE